MKSTIKAISLTAIALGLAGSIAGTAKAQGILPSAKTYSGFYFGASGGGLDTKLATTKNTMTTSGRLVGLPANSFATTTFPGADSSNRLYGGLGGAQIGYNARFGNMVLGIESDFYGGAITRTDKFSGSAQGPQYTTTGYIDAIGSTRARFGFIPFESVLIYGTAGVAYEHVGARLTIQPGAINNPIGTPFVNEQKFWQVGAVYGAGAEVMIDRSWSIKAEWLRLDMPSKAITFDYGTAGRANTQVEAMTQDLYKLGINFHF